MPAEFPKRKVLAVLRRAGLGEQKINEVDRVLGDPVDLDRDGDVLARHGITRDMLISQMGGSP